MSKTRMYLKHVLVQKHSESGSDSERTKDSEDYISYKLLSGKQTKHRESCFRKQTYEKILLSGHLVNLLQHSAADIKLRGYTDIASGIKEFNLYGICK